MLFTRQNKSEKKNAKEFLGFIRDRRPPLQGVDLLHSAGIDRRLFAPLPRHRTPYTDTGPQVSTGSHAVCLLPT